MHRCAGCARTPRILVARFVEARDGDGGVARGDFDDALHLRRVRRERPAPRLDLRVGIAGEEALGKGDDLRALRIGSLQPLLEAREVVLEVSDPRLELTVGDVRGDSERCRKRDVGKPAWHWESALTGLVKIVLIDKTRTHGDN
jgi:hypothetical protein